MTLEQVKRQLSAIEPDEGTYAGIGPEEVPVLEVLLRDREPWMAARAVFAASRIADRRALALVARAAGDSRQEIRVAAAASTRNLTPADANDILLRLLGDTELGVRKFAIQSVAATHSAPVQAKLRDLETQDGAPWIREAARAKLVELRRVP